MRRCYRRATKHYEKRKKCYIDRYRAYRGVLEKAEDVWNSQLSPPYIFQIIETIYAMIAGEPPRDRIMPIGSKDVLGAEALEQLLREQRRNDNFNATYAQWIKQALVLGHSPMKTGWESQRARVRRREYDRDTGEMRVVDQVETIRDQSICTMVPAEDFFWDPSASRLVDSPFAIAQWWIPLDSLKADPLYSNIEMLKDQPRGFAGSEPMKDDAITRDRDNLVQVLEYWDRERLICVANGAVPIRIEENPFWHGRLPFSVCAPVPDLYSLEGISEVELIKDVQAAIWSFLNQRLDNVRLISNAIIMIRDTIDDPDKIDFAPGAVWPVRDPGEVALWTPNQNITEASLAAEAELKSDLLNLTAAVQYLGGAAPEEMQNNTATGINIMSNNAMNRVLAKRQRCFDSLAEISDMQIANIQQLWQGPTEIRLPGSSTEIEFDFKRVHAQDILCNCSYWVEEASESMNRQERRSDALALVQILTPLLPVAAQMGTVINPRMLVEKVLDAYDIKNEEAWFTPVPSEYAPADPNAAGMQGQEAGTPASAGPAPGSLLSQVFPALASRSMTPSFG